jgi:hypothetical protein
MALLILLNLMQIHVKVYTLNVVQRIRTIFSVHVTNQPNMKLIAEDADVGHQHQAQRMPVVKMAVQAPINGYSAHIAGMATTKMVISIGITMK